jgi:hypothetical protein
VILAFGTPDVASTVSCEHFDLVGRLWVNPGESGGGKETNGIDDDANGFVDDVNGANFDSNDGDVCLPGTTLNHDTEAARLAVGEVNGIGAVGVAPGAQLMLLSGWGTSVGTFFTEVLDYAQANGARVIVAPYGGWVGGGGPFQNAAECAAFGNPPGQADYSQDLSQSPVLVFWGRSDEFPGCDPSAVGLGFTDSRDVAQNAATPFVDLAAPGGRGWIDQIRISWALPVAGGVAALALDRNPGLTRAALLQRLIDAAEKVGDPNGYDPNGWSPSYGFGRVNAYQTLLHGDLDLDGIDGDASTATETAVACSATACARRGRAWAATTTAPPSRTSDRPTRAVCRDPSPTATATPVSAAMRAATAWSTRPTSARHSCVIGGSDRACRPATPTRATRAARPTSRPSRAPSGAAAHSPA